MQDEKVIATYPFYNRGLIELKSIDKEKMKVKLTTYFERGKRYHDMNLYHAPVQGLYFIMDTKRFYLKDFIEVKGEN